MSHPECIVCGKKIAKRFHSISFLPLQGNRQNYDRSEDGCTIYLELDLRPTTKQECQRFTNHEILTISMHLDHVFSFKWWEGEYEDEFFCSQKCARRQGYASAHHGERFAWRKT